MTDRGQVKLLDFGLTKVEGGEDLRVAEKTSSKMENTLLGGTDLTSPGSAVGTVSLVCRQSRPRAIGGCAHGSVSLGTVLYRLAGGMLRFKGDTAAVVFDAILNRTRNQSRRRIPRCRRSLAGSSRSYCEKDRTLRCQTASELKTDLNRLKRNLESGGKRAAEVSDSKAGTSKPNITSVAVLYFENLSGAKEVEYLRDGITEDIITELSKIRGLNTYSRSTVLAFRDKQVTPSQIRGAIERCLRADGKFAAQ